MGFLRDLFGPSREEVWRQLAAEIGGQYVQGGFWKTDKVQARVRQWTVTLDTFTESVGEMHSVYTRLRAPYVNRDGFRFRIYREGFFSGLGRALGMQDIKIGDATFDRDFVLQGNNETQLKRMLADVEVRGLLQRQPCVHFEVTHDKGLFGFGADPEGVDELYFQASGVICDLGQLKDLYALFAATLDRLCVIGSACETPPAVKL